MPLFKSSLEKRLWLYVCLVLIGILSSLTFSSPLIKVLGNQNIQAVIFLLGMILAGITVFTHGLRSASSKTELAILLGFVAVYLMVFLRLGLTERSHLIEYSVLAVFIHKALIERIGKENNNLIPAALSFVAASIIGAIDETIQIFLPSRVFDPVDILFNSSAAFMAIGVSMMLQWARHKYPKPN